MAVSRNFTRVTWFPYPGKSLPSGENVLIDYLRHQIAIRGFREPVAEKGLWISAHRFDLAGRGLANCVELVFSSRWKSCRFQDSGVVIPD